MKYSCVTSMSKAYYDHIGQAMIDTWEKYWNIDSILYVYSEDDLSFINTDKIKFIDWNIGCLDAWTEFCKSNNNEHEIKFAKKGYTCIDAWKNIKADRVVWIDADIIFSSEVSQSVIDDLLPDNKLVALFTHRYLKDRYEGWSSESGFFILNQDHKDYNKFTEIYETIYNAKQVPASIVGLADHKILMLVASQFIDELVDLSDLRNKEKTTTPLNHSTLSKYMSHYKGNVKYRDGFKV